MRWANKNKWIVSNRDLYFGGKFFPEGSVFQVVARHRDLVKLREWSNFARINWFSQPSAEQIAGRL